MKKLIMILAIVAVLFALFGVDNLIRDSYNLELVSMEPQPAVADGNTPVQIAARLTRHRLPVEGHTLYILPQRGSFYSARVVTDENGMANFTYYPYLANSFIEAKPVSVEIYDEDNSIFIYVPVTLEFDIALEQPKDEQDASQTLTMDDIFGDD